MERTTLSALGALLGELGIRWVLIGALAANRYRTSPRLTEDVDLLLQNAGRGSKPWNPRRATQAGACSERAPRESYCGCAIRSSGSLT